MIKKAPTVMQLAAMTAFVLSVVGLLRHAGRLLAQRTGGVKPLFPSRSASAA